MGIQYKLPGKTSGRTAVDAVRILLWLSVPAGVFLSTIIFPLEEVFRQGLVGIILVWIYTGVIYGFGDT